MKRAFYRISGYRYAPESFRAWKIYNVCPDKEISLNLTPDQSRELGNICICKGVKAGVDYLKRIDRQNCKRVRLHITYGYRIIGNPRTYLYIRELFIRADASIDKRLYAFCRLKQQLMETNGQIEGFSSCTLNGEYQPENVKQKYLSADFRRPILIKCMDQ